MEGDDAMLNRASKFSRSLAVLALAILMTAPVFGQSASRSITISRDAMIGDQKIGRGKYTLVFDGEKEGQLSIQKNGREVARASYKLVDLGKEADDSAIVFAAAEDGSLKVRRIELKGLSSALQLN
jgi:hypothetical protein